MVQAAADAAGRCADTVGRFWIEYLRIDEAQQLLDLRLNNWTSIVLFVGAVTYLVISARRRPGIEDISGRDIGADAPDVEKASA
ncbi:hypothetical protein [Streptomyces labedae]|uniref:Cbb3-type cytochrome c oxidase subunit 3 n=1 Tax=Streptomyces labedae TaxID=285569 RepID=A0ABP6QV27_9ACTN